jgi:hypothetical protein
MELANLSQKMEFIYGVEVFGKVFDNLSTEGLSREAWLNNFHCASGKFVVDELISL